jgi:hypothetical protein
MNQETKKSRRWNKPEASLDDIVFMPLTSDAQHNSSAQTTTALEQIARRIGSVWTSKFKNKS